MIDTPKSSEKQIKLFKKVEDLYQYWRCSYDDKEIKFKIFKLNLVCCLNFIDKGLFEKLLGYPLIKLANKLINTTNKEENQIIIKDFEKNRNILYETNDYNDWVIQPNSQSVDLIDTIKLILDFNKEIQLDDDLKKIITNAM